MANKNQYFHESCAPDVANVKVMTTKFDGKCSKCQAEYSQGDSIGIIFADDKAKSGGSATDSKLSERLGKLEQSYVALVDTTNKLTEALTSLKAKVAELESSAF